MKHILITFAFIGAFASCLIAQGTMDGGVITYKLTDLQGEVSMQAQMMKGSEIALTFQDQKQKMTMAFMMGMVEINILQLEPDSGGIVLTNMMGKKIKVVGERPVKEKTPKLIIVQFPTDTKTIAGYDCHKVNLTTAKGQSIDLYVTNKVEPELSYFKKMFPGLKGFPLQYSVLNNGMTMIYEAQSIVDVVPEDAFVIPEDYEEMSAEEFKENIGGGAMMGF